MTSQGATLVRWPNLPWVTHCPGDFLCYRSRAFLQQQNLKSTKKNLPEASLYRQRNREERTERREAFTVWDSVLEEKDTFVDEGDSPTTATVPRLHGVAPHPGQRLLKTSTDSKQYQGFGERLGHSYGSASAGSDNERTMNMYTSNILQENMSEWDSHQTSHDQSEMEF